MKLIGKPDFKKIPNADSTKDSVLGTCFFKILKLGLFTSSTLELTYFICTNLKACESISLVGKIDAEKNIF